MITEEQAKQIKQQILSQIDSWPESIPLKQKQSAKAQIQAMNHKELEEFLIKNNLIKSPPQSSQPKPQSTTTPQCIFCSIKL